MFGAYTILLALHVVIRHLGGIKITGAVFCFFMLSGYLMTFVMHETYGYSSAGIRRFAVSRFFRVYPPYWAGCVMSLALIALLGNDTTRTLHRHIFLPEHLGQILQNTFMVFGVGSPPRLVPPAWCITIQILFYIGIACGLSRTKRSTLVWFSISLFYTLFVNIAESDWTRRLTIVPLMSLPFSAGALIFHFKDRILATIHPLKSEKATVILVLALVVNSSFNRNLEGLNIWGFYANFLLNGLLIMSLSERKSILGLSKAWDRRIGTLSFPMFLFHIQCGLLTYAIGVAIGLSPKPEQPLFALLSLPLIVLISWLANKLVLEPVDKVRKRIKINRQVRGQLAFSSKQGSGGRIDPDCRQGVPVGSP